MNIIAAVRGTGKSILQTWAELKRRHLIDYDPMDKLENDVVAYFCIIHPKYIKYTNGLTHVRVECLDRSHVQGKSVDPMTYIHFAEVVWAVTRDGSRFCYKSRHLPRENMRISDDDFCMLIMKSVDV